MINIVRPLDGWVLQRIAESWIIPDSKISAAPDYDADVNVWVNYALFKSVGKFLKTRCDIGYFTHREPGDAGKLFDAVASKMDWCISMCEQTARGLPTEKTTIIHASPDPQFRKSAITIGVCCREYPRKNTGLISTLREIDGIKVRFTGGRLPFGELPAWFASIDYLVVLSDLEGGPLPVVEALAMGKPVIAPDVGWCWEYPVLRYCDREELISIVRRLIVPSAESESRLVIEAIESARK